MSTSNNLKYFTQASIPPLDESARGEEAIHSAPSILQSPIESSPEDIRVSPCSLVAPKSDEGGSVVSPETDEESFNRLAAFTPAQYDRMRKAEAKRLGIRIETLGAEVARCRLEADYDAQARAIKLPLLEPWPEPVDGAEVLHQVAARFVLRVLMPLGAPHALALWDGHAHAFRAFLHTPRLNLTSLESECGKTTTVDLIAAMTPRAMRTENLTAPVLFRIVAQHQPTLLLDEVDSFLLYTEELRGL